MPLALTWPDILLRLALTAVAGAIIGFNREARGHAAGLRTTILVALAAAVAMIQANILLPAAGKTAESFGVMDLMRFPLGILTGVGFIGGGAILKRGDLVTGVTTAATLWMATVIGLCLGGGQLGLGSVATVLSAFTLWALKPIDIRVRRMHRAIVEVRANDIRATLGVMEGVTPPGYTATYIKQRQMSDGSHAIGFEIEWKQAEINGPPDDLIDALNRTCDVISFEPIAEDR